MLHSSSVGLEQLKIREVDVESALFKESKGKA
jgi:hypothetical protein